MQSLRQSITSAVDEFQEASQRVLRAMEDAGDPFRSKTPLSASITLSVSVLQSELHCITVIRQHT